MSVVRLLIKFLIEKFSGREHTMNYEIFAFACLVFQTWSTMIIHLRHEHWAFQKSTLLRFIKVLVLVLMKRYAVQSSAHRIEFMGRNIYMSVGSRFGVISTLDGIFFSVSSPFEYSVGLP